MAVEVHTVRSFFTKLNVIALVLAIIILGLSVASSPKAQSMFAGFAIILIIIILLGQFRVNRSRDLKQAGERAVQTVWLWTSLGLVAVTMPPTPYFELSQFIMAAMMIMGAILVLMGAYSLIKIRKLTGVYLSV
jgi:FtsH-binding integral membrane protein